MHRFAVWLALGVLLAASACGEGKEERPSKPLGTGGLARALEITRQAGAQPMRLVATTSRPGRGTVEQFRAEGELDLADRAGRATLRLPASSQIDIPPMKISWTAHRVTAAGGQERTRKEARLSGGQLGLLPDEAQGLAELVADARVVRELESGRWAFEVPSAAAIRRGIPPQPRSGRTWRGEAQSAADGRLRRVRLRLSTPALGDGGRFPAGTATLELALG